MTSRIVHCEDAIKWLESQSLLSGSSLLGSLPDISEFPSYSLVQWKEWFIKTAELILSKTDPNGVTLFYQTDIKVDGRWVDKGYLVQKAAENLGHELLWHKIICRIRPGGIMFGRPAYSHVLCFSKNLKVDVSKSTADVIPDIGDKTWERGMGLEACIVMAKFVATQTPTKTLVNVFCGEGSMLAAANAFGLDAVGVERSPKRAEKARNLSLNLATKLWDNQAQTKPL